MTGYKKLGGIGTGDVNDARDYCVTGRT